MAVASEVETSFGKKFFSLSLFFLSPVTATHIVFLCFVKQNKGPFTEHYTVFLWHSVDMSVCVAITSLSVLNVRMYRFAHAEYFYINARTLEYYEPNEYDHLTNFWSRINFRRSYGKIRYGKM